VLSTQPSAPGFSIAGVPVHVNLGSALLAFVLLDGTGAGSGTATLALPIPAAPRLVGTTVFAQWMVGDANAAGAVAVSAGARLTFF
jgi:hypothetical protein